MFIPLTLGVMALLALANRAEASFVQVAPGQKEYPQVRSLADKWGTLFGVDPSWVVTHCFVESTNDPKAHNRSAYGIMQIIFPGTASDIARMIRHSTAYQNPQVASTMKRWTGKAADLFNPDLNIMFGTFYLAYLKRRFNTTEHWMVAAAYNQGPGALSRALRNKKLTPAMNQYLAMIKSAKQRGYV